MISFYRLATVEDTAGRDIDFTTNSTSVIFGINEVLKCVNVTLRDDAIPEDMENFFVTMMSNSNSVNPTPNNLPIYIRNDDKG